MKKNLLLLLIIFLGASAITIGQNYNPAEKNNKIAEFKKRMNVSNAKDAYTLLRLDSLWATSAHFERKSKLKSTGVKKSLIDTAYTYPWIAEKQQWDTIPTGKVVYTYDANYNLTNYLSQTKNAAAWQNTSQYTYIYNEDNQLTNVLQQTWKTKSRGVYAWVNTTQKSWTYDSLNRELNFVAQTWNVNKNKWVYTYTHDFSYDSLSNKIQTLEHTWSASTNSWVLSCKYINKYDSLNRIVLNPIQVWNGESWDDAAQSIYSYDNDGNKTSMLYQEWDTELIDWRNAELDSMYYQKSNKLTSWVIKIWDTSLSDWYYVSLNTFEYDTLGNNINLLSQDYLNNYYLVNSSKKVYEYDSLNTQISDGFLVWNLGADNWSSGTLTKMTISYYTVLKSSQAEPNDNILQENQFGQAKVEVFPNPIIDFVTIKSNSTISEIQVFDITGKKIIQQNMDDLSTLPLDLSSLKSGIYILRIKDSNGLISSSRIIKQK